MTTGFHDPAREARELREQLSSDRRRLGFLFGAGTSQAVGIDGIARLTESVVEGLPPNLQGHCRRFLGEFGSHATIEQVLNLVRLCRELLRGQSTASARGLTLEDATALDRAICTAIYDRVQVAPPGGLTPHIAFAQWLRSVTRVQPPEIFTTNYDLLIEQALEQCDTPHFDGFVGTVEPRFSAASVEAEPGSPLERVCPPPGWIRVWKLHGSTNWRLRSTGGSPLLFRSQHGLSGPSEELMIFPSQDKYSESRKLPFLTLQDRLRRFLGNGEGLFVTCGYSFSDQHINEIIFEALRWNNRLAVTALMFGNYEESSHKFLVERAGELRNLTVHFADFASIAGRLAKWASPPAPPANLGSEWPFWDPSTGRYTLGDFSRFGEYLRLFLGAAESTPHTDISPVTQASTGGHTSTGPNSPAPITAGGNGHVALSPMEQLPA